MRKDVALKLKDRAKQIASDYSIKDREFNYNKETFNVHNILPLSETTAAVIFAKTSGKRAVAFFYYLNSRNGHWQYFFITDSHLLGIRKIEGILEEVEQYNFKFNFGTKVNP